jgi:tetratricopeptide (TPR) repeat protein
MTQLQFTWVSETVISAATVPVLTCQLPAATSVRFTCAGGAKILALRIALLLAMFALPVSSAQGEDPLKQHYEAAGKLVQSGDRQRAFAEYKAFLAQALHRIANGKADASQFDTADPLFEEALGFSAGDLDLKLDYAKACFDADKLIKARSLAEAVAGSPSANRAAARLLLGRVLFHLGEFEPARQQLEKVFAEKPEFNVGYLLAKTYLLLHQDQTARDLLQGMAENFGDTAENHVFFGRAYSETDHAGEAIAEFRRAMAKDGHAADAHYYLGLAYLGHNESAGYAQAIPEFRSELQLNPNDFRSHYMLGYIALKQRDLPGAERELSSALAAAISSPASRGLRRHQSPAGSGKDSAHCHLHRRRQLGKRGPSQQSALPAGKDPRTDRTPF